MEESEGFLYDTFGTLGFPVESDPDPAPAPAQSYEVFRNHVTSSADSFAEIPVTDYFSLDVATASPSADELPGPLETPPPSSVPRGGDSGRASELAWFRAGSRFKSPMLQLHKEILDFCDFISPTPEEQASRNAAVQCIFDIVKHIWPHCKVEVFGSFRTGLYLPTSDAVILESEVKTPQIGLYALARALSQRGVVIKMQVIAKARVPIIKFVEKRSGIAFDISFDVDSGPRAADFIKVYSGGIGSYALLVMLIMHWRGQDSREYHQPMEHNLGILLVGFFEFFGRKLNSWDVGISCNSKSLFFVKNDKGFMNLDKPYLLSIEDPQAPDNDIGRNSYNYYKVRSALAMAYSTLTDAKAIMRLGPQRSVLGTIIRPDPLLLDRRGGNSGQLTFNNVLSGAGEPVARQFQNGDDVVYNWQLVDDEPLPREKVNVEDGSVLSSKRISKSRRRLGRSEKLEAFDSKHEEMSIKRASVVKRRKGSQHRDVFGK
ncbi:Nucleotidyltransferase domain [Musa troglodytarum]|uniref:polynucleotide adenylyltransferase n=1 Tax=Musa troglodytarum TaxID=320322 RepID=A0A9E7HLD9_9LILI|nr:Nucleotidyltransferase domain [Musa troglodytarum]